MLAGIKRKLHSVSGFTMTEMLLAVILLLLASEGMAVGIRLSQVSFEKSLRESESKVLLSTLESTIDYELSYTGTVEYSGTADVSVDGSTEKVYSVSKFYSPTYHIRNDLTTFAAVDENGVKKTKGGGYIMLGATDTGTALDNPFNGKKLIAEAAYTGELRARIDDLSYHMNTATGKGYYSYILSIYNGEEEEPMIKETVEVIPGSTMIQNPNKPNQLISN